MIRTANGHALLAADIGLIDFNRATVRAERGKAALAHRFTNAVRQEPSGLDGQAQGARQLVRADALLAAGDQIHGLKPHMQRNLAALEDGAHADGEGLPALIALVEADTGRFAAHQADALDAAAMRASRAFRPHASLYIGECLCFVVEVDRKSVV